MAVRLRDDGNNIAEGQYCHGRHLLTVHRTRRDEQHVDYTAQVHAYLLHETIRYEKTFSLPPPTGYDAQDSIQVKIGPKHNSGTAATRSILLFNCGARPGLGPFL